MPKNSRKKPQMERNRSDENTCRVTNIPPEVNEGELRDVFGRIGRVIRIFIARDKITRLNKGFAFVKFEFRDDADRAIAKLNDIRMYHMAIKITLAAPGEEKWEREKDAIFKSLCQYCRIQGTDRCPKTIACPWNVQKPETRILILGLDNAGKTTLIRQFLDKRTDTIEPHLGYVERVEFKNTQISMSDQPGGTKYRKFWHYQYGSTDALIWVVDSSDRERLTQCSEELKKLLQDERLAGVPVLVAANKSDLPGAIDVNSIAQVLERQSIKTHNWKIFSCCALSEPSRERLLKGVHWLCNYETHDELKEIKTDTDYMELIDYEVAIDSNFQILYKPTNAFRICLRESLHRAYYNLLRRDLAKDPPELEFCFGFLMELKIMILDDILTAQHTRLKAEINSRLDEPTLRGKMEAGQLEIDKEMKYIIDLCPSFCSPGRDGLVAALRKKTDIIDIFQGTMELLELTRNDMTNYQISRNRSAIVELSAKHEYEMFQKSLAENPNGCNFTRQWLKIAYEELFTEKDPEEGTSSKKEKSAEDPENEKYLVDTTSRGYVKLVQVDEYADFPETLKVNRSAMMLFSEKFLQIVMCASAMFVTCNVAGRQISESDGFKKTLKDHLVAITNNADRGRIKEDLKKIGEQCVKEASDTAVTLKLNWNPDNSVSIRNRINALINPENPIRKLVHSRVATFVEEMLRSPTSVPDHLLPGLSVIQSELCAFTSEFLRLCVDNRKTFYTLYSSLILEFQDHAPSTHAVYHANSPSSMPGPSQPGPSSSF